MSNPLENWEKYKAFSEVYEIVKSAVIVGKDDKTYRLEIQLDYTEKQPVFVARYFVQEKYTIQPTYPQSDGKFDREPEDVRIWKALDMPWVRQDSLEMALAQALVFLAEDTKGSNPKNKGPKNKKILKLFKSDKRHKQNTKEPSDTQ